MKKLILLFLISITSYGQAEFPEGVQITGGQPTATSSSTLTATDGTGLQVKVAPENILLNVSPHPINYSVTDNKLGSHLIGIDNKIGTIVQTTAGVTNRINFTGDQTTITAGTFYLSNATGKGSVASAIQSVSNNDNEKKYFTTDVIGVPAAAVVSFPAGVYAGQLTCRVSPNSASQRYTIEIYKTDNGGTPIASGVTGAPTGSLGVTVVAILDSGIVNLADGAITGVPVSGNLIAPLSIGVGERIRYHISAEKVGTTGSNITMDVIYGSNYNSYYDVPVVSTTDNVQNKSLVTGATTTEALNSLQNDKENISNKSDSYTASSSTTYASTKALVDGLATKPGGGGTTNFIAKWGTPTALTNSTIFDNGNVGVGTPDPQAKLTVIPSTNHVPGSVPTLKIGESTDNNNYGLGLSYYNSTDGFRAKLQAFAAGTPSAMTLNPEGGKLLIGTVTDTGDEILQVNGEVSAISYSGISLYAKVSERVSKDGEMLRRAINSVRYAPVTENRQYAYTSLNAAKRTNTDGGSRAVWEPDGVGSYGHSWTRDQSMCMEGYLDYFSIEEINNVASYILSKSNLSTGEVPDHISHTGTVYWTPGTTNDWGSRAPIDGNTYLVQMFWLSYVKSGDVTLYNTNKTALKQLIETGISYNATTKCVNISDASPYVGFGFYDAVKVTGDVLFPSVLAYRAYLQLAELEFATGDVKEALRLQNRATEIKDGINATLLNYYDIEAGAPSYVRKLAFYKAATIKGVSQLDMWGTLFAVWSDIPEGGFDKMISSNLVGIVGESSPNNTVYQGGVRHVVKGTDYSAGVSSWESYFSGAITFGTYQNGGFWHTATPWLCYAIAKVDPSAAKAQYDLMISSMQSQSGSVRPVEWLTDVSGAVGAGKYGTSAIAPLMCGSSVPYLTSINTNLTGTPTAPTAAAGTNTTQIANCEFVNDLVSGASYTPALTPGTNVTSATLTNATYTKVGNVVTVSVGVQITPTVTSLNTVLAIQLPFARATTATINIGNSNLYTGTSYIPAIVQSNATGTSSVVFYAVGVGSHTGTIQFQYSILD